MTNPRPGSDPTCPTHRGLYADSRALEVWRDADRRACADLECGASIWQRSESTSARTYNGVTARGFRVGNHRHRFDVIRTEPGGEGRVGARDEA